MKKLIIDRTKWLRGEGSQTSYLLRAKDKKMCCLGFYSLACGLREDQITDKRTVQSVVTDNLNRVKPPATLDDFAAAWGLIPSELRWLVNQTAGLGFVGDAADLMIINDDELTRWQSAEREQKITEIFAKHDVEVEFIN